VLVIPYPAQIVEWVGGPLSLVLELQWALRGSLFGLTNYQHGLAEGRDVNFFSNSKLAIFLHINWLSSIALEYIYLCIGRCLNDHCNFWCLYLEIRIEFDQIITRFVMLLPVRLSFSDDTLILKLYRLHCLIFCKESDRSPAEFFSLWIKSQPHTIRHIYSHESRISIVSEFTFRCAPVPQWIAIWVPLIVLTTISQTPKVISRLLSRSVLRRPTKIITSTLKHALNRAWQEFISMHNAY